MCHQQYALWDGDPYIDELPLQSSSLIRRWQCVYVVPYILIDHS